MIFARFCHTLRTSTSISWRSIGKLQQTLGSAIEKSGTTLHSGAFSTVKLFPAMAGEGRFFVCGDRRSIVPASIDFVTETVLCTTLCRDGSRVRTVEHLLSALEATGVDNCRIEITGADEVPLLDGSAQEWVDAIEKVGLFVAKDYDGSSVEKMAPFLHEPVHLWKNDSFIVAFPSSEIHITYGINFPQVPAIGCQWFSSVSMDDSFYVKQIASSRTFCIYEEVEQLRNAGLIRGGSVENAIVCSSIKGWLNPPLRFTDEPCRHKILDLVGDLSLLHKMVIKGFQLHIFWFTRVAIHCIPNLYGVYQDPVATEMTELGLSTGTMFSTRSMHHAIKDQVRRARRGRRDFISICTI